MTLEPYNSIHSLSSLPSIHPHSTEKSLPRQPLHSRPHPLALVVRAIVLRLLLLPPLPPGKSPP